MGTLVRGGTEDHHGRGTACRSLVEGGRPQQRNADLQIRYKNTFTNAKETGKKLLALIEHARKV
jgi:hypothetical protein